jgi:ParB family chromosome partitioning protein
VVEQLMESIESIGLQTPISLATGLAKRDGGGPDLVSFTLVAGRHRLAACQRLGWDEIDASIVQMDDRERRMWEISENLHRGELSVLERAQHIDEWVKLSLSQVGTTSRHPNDQGIRETARNLDVAKNEVHRAHQIARLHVVAQTEAQKLGLDNNQSALLGASRGASKEEQIRSLQEHAARRAAPRQSPAPLNDEETEEQWLSYMMRGWNRGARQWRERFLVEIDRPAADSTAALRA